MGDRRRKRKRRQWFDIFSEFDRLEEMMNDMIQKTFEEPFTDKSYQPYVPGFSMSVGSEGKPKIREERKPLVDIVELETDLLVVVGLLGVDKEDINSHVTKNRLTISVDAPGRRYKKEIKLPKEVDSKSSRASYKNGVLQVHLKKSRKPSIKK